MNYLLVASILLFSLASCGEHKQAQNEKVGEIPEPENEQPNQERPDTIIQAIPLEGIEESDTLILYNSPEGWPLPFSTYVSSIIKAESVSSGEGDAVVFTLNQASLRFFVFPEGTSQSGAQKMASQVLGTNALQSCEFEEEWEWGCLYDEQHTAEVNRIRLGKIEDRLFYFHYQYLAEYADGFAPRIETVLQRWQWQNQ
jgi:hypothetical protein